MKHVYDKDFKYTQAKDSTVERLRERFKAIREEIERNKLEKEVKVKPIIRVRSKA